MRHSVLQIHAIVLFISFVGLAKGLVPPSARRQQIFLSRSNLAGLIFDRPPSLHATLPSFGSRFDKWRFLQELLDGDVQDEVMGLLLFRVLDDFWTVNGLPEQTREPTKSGSPELSPELITKIQMSIEELRQSSQSSVPHYFEDGAMAKFHSLLPDPVEDEDANKSAWDTVMEIHGQDMVRANETNPTTEWRKVCLVARLLIHYDFLSKYNV